MRPSFAAGGVEPSLVIVARVLRDIPSRDYVVVGRLIVIEDNEDEDEVVCEALDLVGKHPFGSTPLLGLDLDADRPAGVRRRDKNVDAASVPQR